MPNQHPEDLRVLVPESMREDLQRRVTRRQALMTGAGGALALYLSACGGGTSSTADEEQAAEQPSVPSDAKVEAGPLLLANWVDYSDPENYKQFQTDTGPKVSVTSYGSNDELLAKLRAGGSKFDVVAPTGYAVKTMIDQKLALKLNRDLIPNMKNISPAFTKTEYDPGNVYSVPKDYGITSFYWLDEKVPNPPTTIKEAFDFLKTPEAKNLRVNFLEGGTQVVAIALKALGFSLNSEDEGELEQAKQLLLDVKPNIDTINSTFIERASAGQIDFGMGWNGDIRRAIVELEKKDKRLTFMVPEDSTEYWVDNWAIPTGAGNPVAAHKFIDLMLDPVAAGKEMNYHAYPVPVEGIQGVEEDLANDPVINISQEKIQSYETQLQTAKGQQLRDRIYTEFKAA